MYADVKAEVICDNLGDIIMTLKETATKLLVYSKEKSIDPREGSSQSFRKH